MGHAEPVQTGWYEQYWRPLEKAFGVHYRESFDSFLRDFLVLELRTSKPARLDRVYREFRQWYPAVIEPQEAAHKLAKLLRFGRYYCQFSFGANEGRLEEPFRRLRQLIEVASPVVMALAECHHHHRTLSLEGFIEAVEMLESYVFRRSLVGAQTRNLGAIFGGLAHRVKPERPLGSLKAALARQGKSREFPDDEAFRTGLLSQDIYGRRTCFYLLERLTNAGREKVQASNLTVEHVLPQNPKLSPEWQAMLGEDWRGIQARCLHKLGNLTLTAFNTEFSDRPFAEKKAKQPGGYANSPVWLNSSIAAQDAWGEKEIAERGGLLADRALTIWKPLQVSVGDLTQAELDEAKERSSGYTVDGMPWDEQNRALFDDLRQAVLSLDPAVVELPYAKSVVYRAPDWFVEVLPRAKHLTLRLAPEPEEMASISAKIEAADSWSFIINSVVDGGTLFEVWSKKDVDIGRQLIARAFELAAE
jgi:predicted transport protein